MSEEIFTEVVEDINTIPENMRGLYEERDGKHYMKDHPAQRRVKELEAQMAKQAETIQGKNNTETELQKQLKIFQDSGFTPEQLNQLREQMTQEEYNKASKEGKLIEFYQEKNKIALQEKDGIIEKQTQYGEKYKGLYENLLFNSKLSDQAKDMPWANEAAKEDGLAFMRNAGWKLNDDGTDLILKDSTGKAVYSENNPNQYKTPKEFLDEMKQNRPHLFTTGNKGGGAQGSQNRTNAAPADGMIYFDQNDDMAIAKYRVQITSGKAEGVPSGDSRING